MHINNIKKRELQWQRTRSLRECSESSVKEQRDSPRYREAPLRIRLWISVGDRIINRTPHSLQAGAGVREGEHKEEG